MPWNYRIDPFHRLVIGSGTGVVTKEEMVAYLRIIKSDKCFDPSYDLIEETKDISEIRINSQELLELAGILIFDRNSRRARIAQHDLFFAISRMYEAYREGEHGENFCVFRDIENAICWINEGRLKRHIELIDPSFNPFAVLKKEDVAKK